MNCIGPYNRGKLRVTSALADFFREEHRRRGGVEEQSTDGDSVVRGEPADAGKAVLELRGTRGLHLNLRDACRGEEGRQVGQRQIRAGNALNCGGDVRAMQTDVIGGNADA